MGMGSKWIAWAISEISGMIHRHKAKTDYKTLYHPQTYVNAIITFI